MTVTVAYHSDRAAYSARPAINVKCYTSGMNMWPESFGRAAVSDSTNTYGSPWTDYIEAAYNRIQSDFWQAAEQIATERGLGPIEQEGRSGGWLVLTDGRDPDYDNQFDSVAERRHWLGAYKALAAWCAEQVASAPQRIARRAEDIAMDENGYPAARRMFAR